MYAPARLAYALRPKAPAALIAAALASTLMFAATPFLVTEVSARYGVSEGTAGWISVVQVAFFAVANLVLPRIRINRGRVFRISAVVFALANLASAGIGQFAVLMAIRAIGGAAAGAMTWLVWSDAMSNPRSMASIAASGPLAALLGAPVIALAALRGDRAIYLLLTVAAIGVLVWPVPVGVSDVKTRRRVSRSRSNRVLLLALMTLTMAGASLFVYEAVAAREVHGLSPQAASIGFSLNAAGALLGANLAKRHRRPGVWLASVAVAAWVTIGAGSPVLWYVAMTWWGFGFWMGVPGVLQMLADRSIEPGERAGDAQAYMAIGRSIAPLIGGAFVDAGNLQALAVVSALGLGTAGLTVVGVQEGRSHLPPTEPLAPYEPTRG